MGAGTGGTVTGIGRKFKEKLPTCKIVVADPIGSSLAEPPELNRLDRTSSGFYEVEGIGYDFNPTVLDKSIADKWYKTVDQNSFILARQMIRYEGILVGGSSGQAALYAALQFIKDMNYQDDETKRIVVILPDGIRNYMSKFLSDDWMNERFPETINGYH